MPLNDTTHQFIKTLTDNFLNTLTQQVQQKVVIDVSKQMEALNVPELIDTQISSAVDTAISTYKWPLNGNKTSNDIIDGITGKFKTSTDAFLSALTESIQTNIINDLADRLGQVDVPAVVREQITAVLANTVKTYSFPAYSIPGSSINPTGLTISADAISGGTHKQFESTGIQDKSTECQVTILDAATVFENRLVSYGLEVTGDAIFKGNLIIDGTVPDSSPLIGKIVDRTIIAINGKYNDGQYDQYCDRVFTKITGDGIDATKVRVNGVSLVVDGVLASRVTKSNLQSVGELKELQVVGETLLDNTLYVSKRRVGINTREPERALDIWDQEVQIIAGKRQQDVAIFGTARNQNLIVSANGKDQIVINAVDSTVTIKNLNIGKVNHTSATQMPTDNRPLGHLVWNELPKLGAPIGWVSLGGARWATFGTITA